MPRIMCTQKLWNALGHPGRPPVDADAPPLIGSVLGGWALTSFHYDRKGFVLALNERTYLTLVFTQAPRDGFRRRFAAALETALIDLGVDKVVAQHEAMILDFLPFASLTKRSLTGSLNDLEFLCRCELDSLTDLRRVQLNLNDYPHAGRDPFTAREAVPQLFEHVPVTGHQDAVH